MFSSLLDLISNLYIKNFGDLLNKTIHKYT